ERAGADAGGAPQRAQPRAAGRGAAQRDGPQGPAESLSQPTLGRRTPARGDRPGFGQRSGDSAGGRAHRQFGQRELCADHGDAHRDSAAARHDADRRHPRAGDRSRGAKAHSHPRRPDRRKERAMRRAGLALAILLCALPALAGDVNTVLAAQRQRLQTADYRASGHLVRVDANGARTSFTLTLKAHWFPGVLRVLVEISAPEDARAHILLEMRPNGQNVIKTAHPDDREPVILPFEKWIDGPLGPGFSYEDFLEAPYYWPGQTWVEETQYGARDCDVVRSAPGAADRTHYAEVRSWLDHSIGFPVYVEKTM